MWESTSYDNAGGFYENTQGGGAQTPGGGEKKKQRAHNIVATHTRTVLDCGKILFRLLFLNILLFGPSVILKIAYLWNLT